MASRALILSLLLAVPLSAAAVAPEQVQTPVLVTRIEGRVLIDRTGRVAEYTPRTKLEPVLASTLVALVKTVRFEPVEVDGRIVNAEAEMRVSFAAQPTPDGGMKFALDNLVFPDEATSATVPRGTLPHGPVVKRVGPVYPRDALPMQANVDVLAVLRIAPDGSVRDVAIQQSALLHAKSPPRVAARLLGSFERSSVAALRQWRVDPSAMPVDAPRAGADWVALVPVYFRIDGVPTTLAPGQWTLETRTAKRVPEWVPTQDGAPQPGASDLADGELGAPNTRYRLATPLAALAP